MSVAVLRRALALACAVLLLAAFTAHEPAAALSFGRPAVSEQHQTAPLIRASALPLVAIVKAGADKPGTTHTDQPTLPLEQAQPIDQRFAPRHANARPSAFVRLRLAAFAARAPPHFSA